MKKQKIILTIGLPASGKTTWAEEQVKKSGGNIKNINRDDIRNMLGPYLNFTKEREKLVEKIQCDAAQSSVDAGFNIIISDTNLNKKTLRKWSEFADLNDLELVTEESFLNVSYGECIRRDKARGERGEKSVGQRVITGMYEKYKEDYFCVYRHDDTLPWCVICDIDGTLAHMRNRSPFDWEKVDSDKFDIEVLFILDAFKENGYSIFLMSGRDEVSRIKTEQWLNKCQVPYDGLFMRPEKNNEKDSIIKERLFRENILGKYNVLCVLDDRDQVVDMWRGLGLKVLQVAYGDF